MDQRVYIFWKLSSFSTLYTNSNLLVNVVVTSEANSTLVFIFNLGVPNLDVFGYVQSESNRATLFKIFIIFNVVNIRISNTAIIRFYFNI